MLKTSSAGRSPSHPKQTKRTSTAKKKLEADADATENSRNESSYSKAKKLEEDETTGKDQATLPTGISYKQKLIDELEQSQHRLKIMCMQYESKLMKLQQKIRETNRERDRLLSNLSSAGASDGHRRESAKHE
ncbi:hypothetical protein MRX96_007503 [Rhipicephalus microplus]